MLRVLCIVGARPNFIKIAPLLKAMSAFSDRIEPLLVNTGQHYDPKLVDYFFEDLDIPLPDFSLGVGSGSHADQTARVMLAFEPVCLETKPDLVLVVGDVNSTIACSLVASKLGIRIAHVEAGLRSFDRSMPEEINRELTDLLSDYLFTTCEDAALNLQKMGVAEDRIFFVGNVMIDSLLQYRQKAQARPVLKEMDLEPRSYALMTLHRPSNVDDPQVFKQLLAAVEYLQEHLKIVFPAHPRTVKNIGAFKLSDRIAGMKNLKLIPPQGYLDFMALMENAKFVMTDSGGLQEETTILGVPCLTLRKNTERPVTITLGTNVLVGVETETVISQATRILKGPRIQSSVPPLWDGRASQRVVEILLRVFKPRE
jgi:UDP-N-acetylglucosamine 2-epimerase (non-hydrolysing)